MRVIKMKSAAAALVVTMGIMSTADAALATRLGGQAVYDTDRDITWIADANLALSNQFGLILSGSEFDDTANTVGSTGRMTWDNANAWITGMNADGGTLTGVRRPTYCRRHASYSAGPHLRINSIS